MAQGGVKARVVPPEPTFRTTNGLSWVFVSRGYRTFRLKSHGVVQMPVYAPLGSGQYGTVFEVEPAGSLPGRGGSGAKASQFAAKLLFLPDFEAEGVTADVLRETNLYHEISASVYAGGHFANIPAFFGCNPCLEVSSEFAEGYLGGVRHCGVLIVEKCRSDFGQFIKQLWAAKQMNLSSVKFYVWQLLNGVAKLHSQNVAHRDLKPENLLVDVAKVPNGEQLYEEGVSVVKIADLGMGRKVRWELSQQSAGSIVPRGCHGGDAVGNEHTWSRCSSSGSRAISSRLRLNPTGSMRQTGHVTTLPYRPPDLLVVDPKKCNSVRNPVADYGLWCDLWSLGVIFLEMCLPQHLVKPPYRWQYAFASHDAQKAVFQMEVMILENILKIVGRPADADMATVTSGAGFQSGVITKLLRSFPLLDLNTKKLCINDFVLDRGGIQLDELGLDLIARRARVQASPDCPQQTTASGVCSCPSLVSRPALPPNEQTGPYIALVRYATSRRGYPVRAALMQAMQCDDVLLLQPALPRQFQGAVDVRAVRQRRQRIVHPTGAGSDDEATRVPRKTSTQPVRSPVLTCRHRIRVGPLSRTDTEVGT
ncbi:cmgc kinase [Cystoisospora suis]|uniref:Cyclin-dependent kinase 2 homolog n=1 Tax=Cystoisospora suis TaxID=483139 RepID=A0A2C6KKF1_9APIC|nr:cmgc kinase [Cystoisospora suis]